MDSANQVRRARLRFTFYVLPALLAGLAVTAFALRFAMRALGVRDDIPFPGLVYRLTAPVVQAFYRFFPLDARFDYPAIEVASLAAAGAVLAVAVAIYGVVLLLPGGNRSEAAQEYMGALDKSGSANQPV